MPGRSAITFIRKLPRLPNTRLGLFTTYKIPTGSMFRKMNKELDGRFTGPVLQFKLVLSTHRHWSGSPLKRSLLTLLIWSSVASVLAQEPLGGREIEYSAGTSVLIYQSVYSIDETFALEGCVRGVISGSWGWQASGCFVAWRRAVPKI